MARTCVCVCARGDAGCGERANCPHKKTPSARLPAAYLLASLPSSYQRLNDFFSIARRRAPVVAMVVVDVVVAAAAVGVVDSA